MKIVADANTILAVILTQNERKWIIEKTSGLAVVSHEIFPCLCIRRILSAVMPRGKDAID